jgi:hypothetical protein
MNEIVKLTGSLELSEERDVLAQRQDLIEELTAVRAVTNKLQADSATMVVDDARKYLKWVEDSRKTVKEIPLRTCQRIDEIAKRLSDDVKAQTDRVKRLAGDYYAEQERIRKEELRKAEEARQAEIRKAQQEQARIEAEARKKAEAEAAKIKDEAKAEAHRLQVERDIQARKEQAEISMRDMELPVAIHATEKPKGVQIRKVTRWEMVNAGELYKHHPELCEITPKAAEIIKAAKAGKVIHGVKTWEENAV